MYIHHNNNNNKVQKHLDAYEECPKKTPIITRTHTKNNTVHKHQANAIKQHNK